MMIKRRCDDVIDAPWREAGGELIVSSDVCADEGRDICTMHHLQYWYIGCYTHESAASSQYSHSRAILVDKNSRNIINKRSNNKIKLINIDVT